MPVISTSEYVAALREPIVWKIDPPESMSVRIEQHLMGLRQKSPAER